MFMLTVFGQVNLVGHIKGTHASHEPVRKTKTITTLTLNGFVYAERNKQGHYETGPCE